jgi:MFS family permease
MLLTETALLGFGFGLNLSVINHFAAVLFPQRDIAAITVLNAVIGGATALSPLILGWFGVHWSWWLWPLSIGAAFAVTIVVSWTGREQAPQCRERGSGVELSRLLGLFGFAVLIYAVVEGSFGSWATLYAGNHHFAPRWGTKALAAFWGAMTAFRLLLGVAPGRWLPPRLLYLISPAAIAVSFIAVAKVATATGLVIAFACAGAACSIYYPFSMSFALQAFPRAQTGTAGVLVAALMTGEGVGSWLPGPLQHWSDLAAIYAVSALWGVPLLILAWRLGILERSRRLRDATR